jgi:hypothetical protein
MEGDQTEDLIRTDYRNLEDAAWWRSLGGEGVVFYGWGSGKYLKIVRAIKEAGLLLVSHLDTAGMLGFLNGWSVFAGTLWRVSLGESDGRLKGLLTFFSRLGYGMTVGVVRNDFTRARHLRQADFIGAITPVALERIRKVCRIYGGEALANRVRLIPHPNAPYMVHDPDVPKERLVVAVGRWDDAKVKGTDLLMAATRRLAEADPGVAVEIYGRSTPAMEAWHAALDEEPRRRIKLIGIVPNRELVDGFKRARVIVCTSLRESYNIAVAEALCCGCSMVGPAVPETPGMPWFAEARSGRIARREPEAFGEALRRELVDWDEGRRDAAEISRHWAPLLHAPRVAARILEMVDEGSSGT